MVKKIKAIKKEEKNIFLKHISFIRNSAKETFSKDLYKLFFYDVMFIILSTLLILSALSIIHGLGAQALPRAQEINQMQLTGDPTYQDALAEFQPIVNILILKTIIILITTTILEIALISYLYAKPWSLILKNKFNKNNFFKTFFSTLIILILISISLIILAAFLNEKTTIVLWSIMTILLFCFWQLIVIISQEKYNFKKTLKISFNLFIKNIKNILLYFIGNSIIFLVILGICSIFSKLVYLFIFFIFITTILMMTFSRKYFCKLYQSMNKGDFNV